MNNVIQGNFGKKQQLSKIFAVDPDEDILLNTIEKAINILEGAKAFASCGFIERSAKHLIQEGFLWDGPLCKVELIANDIYSLTTED